MFAQYTLVPLVSMYLVILTLYFGKVVVTWDWPQGWIGYLVSLIGQGAYEEEPSTSRYPSRG